MRLSSWSRFPVSLLLLGSGILLSAPIDSGSSSAALSTGRYSAVEPARFDMQYLGGRLTAVGHGADHLHETVVSAFINDNFDRADVDLRPIVIAPENWGALTLRVLETVATTQSATVSITPTQLSVRGVVTDPRAFEARLDLVKNELSAGIALRADVVAVQEAKGDPCKRAFEVLGTQRVEFDRASAKLRSAASPSLDRYVELANDCDGRAIAVIGHTDALGDESWNRKLSLARAQAVVDYMTARGIPAERLVAKGAGASRPLADNGTAWGRVRNRRIEIELR